MSNSPAEQLVAHFELAFPRILDVWQQLIQEGYEARISDKPRQTKWRRGRGARHAQLFNRGWDQADAEMAPKSPE